MGVAGMAVVMVGGDGGDGGGDDGVDGDGGVVVGIRLLGDGDGGSGAQRFFVEVGSGRCW